MQIRIVRKARAFLRRVERSALGDSLFHGLSGAAALALLALLLLMAVVLSFAAWDSIRTFGFSFLTETTWVAQPTPRFGAVPFVYGTLVTSGIALLLAVPVSLGIAIFLSELAPQWIRIPLTYVVELLASVPSVVYGLWGIFVLAPVMRERVEPALQGTLGFLPIFQGPTIGTDIFTAGVILAIMVIPTISSISREALLVVPQSQREAAYSLGATRWETTRTAVLTYARSGIFGAVILGLGRAVGETMAVTMTIGNKIGISVSLFDQGQTIASLIANNFAEADRLQAAALIELGLVLMLMAVAINVFARFMVGRVLQLEEASA